MDRLPRKARNHESAKYWIVKHLVDGSVGNISLNPEEIAYHVSMNDEDDHFAVFPGVDVFTKESRHAAGIADDRVLVT